MRQRADLLLVQRGLFESRSRAQAAIAAGRVSADGTVLRRASDLVDQGAKILAEAAHPFVSRGGIKLDHALDAFAIDPAGQTCLDLGASTGGFADVLLRRKAARVYAVDSGRGQLHPSIGSHPRVLSLEATDARTLSKALIPEPIDLAVADVSFISLKLVLPPVLPLLSRRARLVALIKPQFEAGPSRVRKGIVRDEAVHGEVCDEIGGFVAALGFDLIGIVPSPITGAEGNREFLLGARRDG